MATLNLAEPVLDAVIQKLLAGMPARVAAINTAAADNVTITAPSAGDIYFGGVSLVPRCPALIVFQLPGEGENEAEGPHSFVWVGHVGVAVVEEDSDRQRLARKLLRQVRAVTETIWDDSPQEALTGAAFHIRAVRDDPGPVQEPTVEESFWRAMHLVIFEARQSEG